MAKYAWISAGLSILIIVLLGAHYQINTHWQGHQNVLNMAFGLPIGLALAVNIDIILHKVRQPKK